MCASTRPSTLGGTGGVSRRLRSRAASGPSRTALLRQFSTDRAETSSASAIRASDQPGPNSPWSHLSSAFARVTFHCAIARLPQTPFAISDRPPRSPSESFSTCFSSTATASSLNRLRIAGPPCPADTSYYNV